MTILWQTDKPTTSRLEYGQFSLKDRKSVSVETTDPSSLFHHTLTGLEAGKLYNYRVLSGKQTAEGSFRTAPDKASSNICFLAYGDTRNNPKMVALTSDSVMKLIKEKPAYQTFILHVGDFVGNGDKEKEWNEQFFKKNDMLRYIPLIGARGNHEHSCALYNKLWPFPYIAKDYWSFDYGPVHITVLDQYALGDDMKKQEEWLTKDIKENTSKWKFILMHEPGWSAGNNHSDNLWVRNTIQPLCISNGVQIVFAGHNHLYSRSMIDGVAHIVTGGGGAPLYDAAATNKPYIAAAAKKNHFCRISIHNDVLEFTVIQPNGEILDSMTMTNKADRASADLR